MTGKETLTHKLLLELRQLVFVELSLARGEKLPAQNLRQLCPGERGRLDKERQVLRDKERFESSNLKQHCLVLFTSK